jgi:radical SAM-linked protein
MMAAMERIARRARLPMRYSQGFNPRAKLSLPAPRPVGVTGEDELLVLALDEPLAGQEILDRLNAQALIGLTFVRLAELEAKQSPQPRQAHYRQNLPPDRRDAVRRRVEDLQGQDEWIIERVKTRRTRRGQTQRTIRFDLRQAVADIHVDGDQLHFLCVPHQDRWAKPAEVLALTGQDESADVARLVRTRVAFDTDPS